MSLDSVTTLGDKRLLLPSRQVLRKLLFLESDWSEAWLVFGYRMNGGGVSTFTGSPVIVFGLSGPAGYAQVDMDGSFVGIGAVAAAGNLTRTANGSGFKYFTSSNSNNNRTVVSRQNGGAIVQDGNWRDDWHETSRVDGSARAFPVAMKFERLIGAIRCTPMVYSDAASLPPTEADVLAAIDAAGGNFTTFCTALGGTVGTAGGAVSMEPADLTHVCAAWQPFLWPMELAYVGAWRNPVVSAPIFDPLYAFINPSGFSTSLVWKKNFEALTADTTHSGDADVSITGEFGVTPIVRAAGGTTGATKCLRFGTSGSNRSLFRIAWSPVYTQSNLRARLTWRLRAPTTGNIAAANGSGSNVIYGWNNVAVLANADGFELRTGWTGGVTGTIRASVTGYSYTPGEQYQFDVEAWFNGANGEFRAAVCKTDGTLPASCQYLGDLGSTGVSNPIGLGGTGATVLPHSGSVASDTLDANFTKLDDLALFVP